MLKRNLAETIKFSKSSREYGWLNLWSPHGIRYNNHLWPNCAHAWYGVRYNQKPCIMKIGARILPYYKHTKINNMDFDLAILEDILRTKLSIHTILKTYLLETNDSELIFITSKYSTYDHKRLGFCEENNSGENGLGKLWMKLREEIKTNS